MHEHQVVKVPETSSEMESAEAFERRVAAERKEQFEELRNQARAVFAAVSGQRGIRTEEKWQEMFRKAKIDYASGRFLIEQLGAESYLAPQLMAILSQLRTDLLAGIERPNAADRMMADSAIIAYRNMLRVQGWIGSLCLVVERDLFGEAPLNEIHGLAAGAELETQIARFEERLMPLLDRAHRMLKRSLAHFEARRARAGHPPPVTVGQAGQVNVGSAVRNETGR